MKIGVLALQGDFREHIQTLTMLGVEAVAVRLPQQLEGVHGLIIPGGESTTIGKLMVEFGLVAPLRRLITDGIPTWGTCAGMILLARSTDNALAGQPLLATMDIHVSRNAFGAQRESFATQLNIPAIGTGPSGGAEPFRAVFIRAPVVVSVGPQVEILARLEDMSPQAEAGRSGDSGAEPLGPAPIVAVRQDHLIGTAFHPEVSGDTRFHRYFLEIVSGRVQQATANI
ncbi:MAG TPA: pyridoxal 5'-phosphate synthase glutaminase subunit PdxT [Ktedonobacterales bacterium]|nr:pyridoxal 5'-phosphate synthase glutaminase subunit PdxT [Ktedonobacterales bacterium]